MTIRYRSFQLIAAAILFFFLTDAAHAQPVRSIPDSLYFKLRGGLANSTQVFEQKKQATVAFLGGSITYNPGWREMTCQYLKERFPQVDFHFIAAGIPSLGSLPHAFRFRQDVLDSGKVDLLFIEAAVNDQVNGTDSITQVFALEGIVRQAKKSNPGMDIIMMSFADPDKIKAYNNGNIPAAVANHEYIAGYYHLPSINLAKEVRDRIANKEFSWENDFKDLHPSPFGQRLYFKTIKDLLIKGFGQSSGNFRPKLPEPIHKKNFENGIYARIEEAVGDSKWKLVNNWAPDDNVPVRDKFVHVPVWAAASPGAVLTFTFKGNAVGMAVISGPDAGMVNYSIDGGALKQIDLFTPWSSGLHLPWYVLFAKEMTNKKHTLRLMISDQKNSRSKGNACRIVHFLVNQQ